MSEENVSNTTPESEDFDPANAVTGTDAVTDSEIPPKKIYLVSFPKLIFLYPTFIAALIAGVFTWVAGDDEAGRVHIVAMGFLAVLSLNLIVLTFDFPRTTSLTLCFFVAMVVMGLYLFFHFNPEVLPVVGNVLSAVKPYANASFYFLMAGILFLFYLGILAAVRFDYWEVRPNELLHHHGFLSDLKRYPAPNLRIDKEINDVFEYMLLKSGRLIVHARHESRAIVLDNVLFINKKEQLLTKMLGALQVSVRDDD